MSTWPYSTRRWQRLRLWKFQESPLCEICLNQYAEVVPATVVDHRIPISKAGREQRLAAEAFPALDQLTSLCEHHHNVKTRAEQLGDTNYMIKGCDIFGQPNDPNHPWNRERRATKTKGASR
jgi:5-methylcytosine-specific restriction endonuclease McrA